MVTAEEFIEQFPEFDECGVVFLQAYLDDAEENIDRTVWGESKGDIGQKYLAAHNIALSPFGQQARLVAKGAKTTTYWSHYERMRNQVASGFRVA
jgi:hypothetical protein